MFAASRVELGSDLRKSAPLWGTHGILFHAVYGSVAFDASLYSVALTQCRLTKIKLEGDKC